MRRALLSSYLGGRLWLAQPQVICISIRSASLNSAIGRGIRRSRNPETSSPRRSDLRENRRSSRDDRLQAPERRYQDWERKPKREVNIREFDEDEFIRTGRVQPARYALTNDQMKPGSDARASRSSSSENPKRRLKKSKRGPRAHPATDSVPERVKEYVKAPESIPYTTPASEFIYGTGAVEAALRCSRRQLYKLYLHQKVDEELSPAKVTLRKLALSENVAVKMAFGEWDRLMDKMSAGRPHNGCVLEASPLPKLPVRGFQAVPTASESHFQVELRAQSREEAAVNGTNNRIPIFQQFDRTQRQMVPRFPVVLLLDGVVDPGNLGAVIRSAYYLGVDALVFAGRNSAPLSPVTIKASAGAAENMTMLHVVNEVEFIQRSKGNGWRFYAADAPGPGTAYIDRLSDENSDGHAITQSPSVLMLGSEGYGLSSHIRSQADGIISIPGAHHSAEIGVESDPARIDSLNVAVAAALLMEKFLRTPLGISDSVKKMKDRMW